MQRIPLLLALPALAASLWLFRSGALAGGLVCAGVAATGLAIHLGRVRAEERRWRRRFWSGLRAAVTEGDLARQQAHAALRADDA